MNRRFLILVFVFLFCIFTGVVGAEEGENLYSVEFRGADIKTVVRMLARMSGKNVVVPEKTEGKITASFDDISLIDAMDSILRTNGFGTNIDNNIIEVTTQEELTKQGGDLKGVNFDLKFAKAEQLLPHVQSFVSDRGSAVADDITNTLYVRDSSAAIANISNLIANMDKKGKQVLIEARIIEASTDFVRSLGIQWGVTKSGGKIHTSGLTAVGTDDAGRTLMLNVPAQSYNSGAPLSGVGLILGSFKGVLTDIQLSAAEQNGTARILARPTIATLNNQPASIRSGTKFYVKTYGDVNIGGTGVGTGTTSGTGAGNLREIDTGIELKVTPQISSDRFIRMDIAATQSEADFTQAIDGVPAILDKTATTTVSLRDGETTIIGGLFHLKDAKTIRGVPGLMKIPIFGNLFKSRTKARSKRELLIFLTPRIIESAVDSVPFFAEPDSTLDPNKVTVVEDKKPSRKARYKH